MEKTKNDKVVKYFDGNHKMIKTAALDDPDNLRHGVILDVETTGLDETECEVIEIGLVEFLFNTNSGDVVGVVKQHDFLQQPAEPLSDFIKELTGLSDEKLAGHTFNTDAINSIIENSDIIIAHNAKFDRKFTSNYFEVTDKLWACSKEDVNWKSKGFICNHLQHLCNDNGFYYDGHRAEIDCLAVLKLLSVDDAKTGRPYLLELIQNAERGWMKIAAVGSPFSAKDYLKGGGFTWDQDNKYWYKLIPETEQNAMMDFLKGAYQGKPSPRVTKVDPLKRFL